MVQLLQDLADKFADFAQGMVRGNPLLRMNVRKHPALILRSSAHLQPSRRIRGALNHHSFALARFFSKLLARQLGRGTTHQARRVWRRIENRYWTEAGTGIGRWRRRNEAPGLAVRRLRTAVHHARGRSESKGSCKPPAGINDIRSALRS